MKTVKLSYTIMNAWGSGKYEDAVAMYLGKDIPRTPEMELGRLKATLWASHIILTRNAGQPTLHPNLGGAALNNPVVEQKYEKYFSFGDNYRLLLRGKPDATDDNGNGVTIHENKCGMGEPAMYVDTMQTDYYKLLVPEATEAIYECYNPYFDTVKIGVKFLTDENAENALNHLFTNAGEFIDYLESQRLVRDYQPKEVTS